MFTNLTKLMNSRYLFCAGARNSGVDTASTCTSGRDTSVRSRGHTYAKVADKDRQAVNVSFLLASIVAGSDSMLNAKRGNGVGSLSMSLICVLSVRV